MTKLRPGMVYKLSFDTASGPPKKRFRFLLEEVKTGDTVAFTLSTDVGWWLEAIMQVAYQRLGCKLGEVTLVPTKEMLKLWANSSADELTR